ncbi:unnamed protein product, partial [Symbiodinium sp. KB8]
ETKPAPSCRGPANSGSMAVPQRATASSPTFGISTFRLPSPGRSSTRQVAAALEEDIRQSSPQRTSCGSLPGTTEE